ncbi:hypothetical protein ES703_124393 [subsurface metagenome]
MQGDDRHIGSQCGSQGRGHLVVLPGVQVDDLAIGEQLGDSRRKDAEVSAAVLSGFRPRMAGDPQQATHLEI